MSGGVGGSRGAIPVARPDRLRSRCRATEWQWIPVFHSEETSFPCKSISNDLEPERIEDGAGAIEDGAVGDLSGSKAGGTTGIAEERRQMKSNHGR